MSRVNPKIDLVFKKLFGSEENQDILMSLVNAILPQHQQIAELSLKNTYNVSDYAEGKLSILDIKAQDENGVLYDIEMQIKGTGFYGKRTLYYWAKMFGAQLDYLTEEERDLKNRRGYSDLRKCIVISLMDFVFFEDGKYHRCYMLKDRENNETHADLDYLDLYFVEMDKFDVGLAFVQTALERWIAFLNNAYHYTNGTLPKELAQVKEIKKASAKLDVMYFDEKERQYYESQQKFWLDEISRIQEMTDKMEAAEKTAIETEKALVATQKALAETEKAAAETQRALAESEKAATETQRALAEAEKAAAETQRALAEAEKALTETERAAAETQRALAETEKALTESEKAATETQRALAEAAKALAESERAAAEAGQNSKIEIARTALNKGFDNDSIVELTGLSLAQIQELRNEAKL